MTVKLTVLSAVGSLIWGTLLAAMRVGPVPLMRGFGTAYVNIVRNIPLTVIILNDQAVGQEKHDLVRKQIDATLADTPQPDFDRLAEGFGAKGFRVNRPEELDRIDAALAVKEGPVVVDVVRNERRQSDCGNQSPARQNPPSRSTICLAILPDHNQQIQPYCCQQNSAVRSH